MRTTICCWTARITLATGIAAAGAASAQTQVTLYGVVDNMVSGYRNQSRTPLGVTVIESKTGMFSSGNVNSRVGLRGIEDLGAGMAAIFVLEAGFFSEGGAGQAAGGGLSFNRRSYIGLTSGLGTIRLGRDYTPTFWNDNLFDPFGGAGAGTNLVVTANGGATFGAPTSGFQANRNYARAANSVGYLLPGQLGGFYGQVMYAFDERTTTDPGGLTPQPAIDTRIGSYAGARFGYAAGPLDMAIAIGASTVGSNYFLGSKTNLDIWNLGGSYDFGVLKLYGDYSNNRQKVSLAYPALATTAVKPGANGGLLGISVPIGASQWRASYSAVDYNHVNPSLFGLRPEPTSTQLAIGWVYNFSKKTAIYATFAAIRNRNGAALTMGPAPGFYTGSALGAGAAVPGRSQGYDLGLRVVF